MDLIDRVLHWLWVLTFFAGIFTLGSAAGAYGVAVWMNDYVQEHYVCEEKK